MLISPLDWGLGHASRCVPLIRKLLIAGFKVIIAAEGDQKILLQKAFPHLELLQLPGYRLRYGSTKWQTVLKIMLQIPKMLTIINREKQWLKNYLKGKHLDVIISDNRFGFCNRNTINVFITHQLLIKTSFGNLTDRLLQRLNYRFINRFDYCWVPDSATIKNLAGQLSHPVVKPRTKLVYTGWLSSIKSQSLPVTNKLLILLSGPEPQRTILENILFSQLTNSTLRAVFVRGLPSAKANLASSPFLTVHNFLPSDKLQNVINESAIIISRSGYSTIMDLLPLGKKCIFIPTPGQAEQQYLAEYLSSKNYAVMSSQQDFLLLPLIEKIEMQKLDQFTPNDDENGLDEAIKLLSESMQRKQHV